MLNFSANVLFISKLHSKSFMSNFRGAVQFYTFGHSALEGEPNVFRLYLKNRSGSMSVLEQDVSDQVHDVPVAGHIGDVHLVLNFDYEVPSEPGNGGPGFDVDVDDWDDVNVDIVL